MLVKNWIVDFFEKHRARFGITDWDAPGTEAYRDQVRMMLIAFKTHDVNEKEANDASLALGMVPPRFRNDHIPALIGMITDRRKPKATPDVQEEFHDCGYCEGAGFVTVYHRLYNGSRTIELRNKLLAGVVTAHCNCTLGRQLRARTDPETVLRMPDLADVISGRSRYLLDDPCGKPVAAAGPDKKKAGRGTP